METDEERTEGWSESDSHTFVDRAALFVPSRDEQIETLRSLIPAEKDETFSVVELGAGDGALAGSVLEAFPRCRYLALDGSEVMRLRLGQRLAHFRARVDIGDFELRDRRWRAELPTGLRCVVASLVVHHLSGHAKRQLFQDVGDRLERGGAFLLADIIEAPTPRAAELFARQWDRAVRAQSQARNDPKAFEVFAAEGWNYYRAKEPDPYDQPSRLAEQLTWLSEAGFSTVDCFWMRAGHAIYGGYR